MNAYLNGALNRSSTRRDLLDGDDNKRKGSIIHAKNKLFKKSSNTLPVNYKLPKDEEELESNNIQIEKKQEIEKKQTYTDKKAETEKSMNSDLLNGLSERQYVETISNESGRIKNLLSSFIKKNSRESNRPLKKQTMMKKQPLKNSSLNKKQTLSRGNFNF